MINKDKLSAIIDTLCFGNKAEFARRIKTSPQTITNWMNRGISKDGLILIGNGFSELNPEWLFRNEGEMLREEYRTNAKEEEESEMLRNSDTERMIPFYDAETSGGFSGLVASSSEQANLKGYIQAGGWFDSKETAAIRHIGDSMVEYPSGCVLAVREVLDRRLLVPGRNYVIETTEFRVTKRYQRGSSPDTIALYSTNTETYPDGRLVHEPFEVPVDEIRRIYRVLGYIVNESGEFKIIKK